MSEHTEVTDTQRAINRVLMAAKWGTGPDTLSHYTEAIDAAFVVIPRGDLPAVFESEHGNGYYTNLAQEFYSPCLKYSPEDGDKPGDWNQKIAYANLAVALAVEARETRAKAAATKLKARRNELAHQIAGEAEGDPDCKVNYAGMVRTAQIAIDRIIELEDAVTQPAHVGTITPGQLKEMDCV